MARKNYFPVGTLPRIQKPLADRLAFHGSGSKQVALDLEEK